MSTERNKMKRKNIINEEKIMKVKNIILIRKIIRICVWSLFVLYCMALFFVFIISRINTHIRPYENINNVLARINLIPFKTVYEYIDKIINNRINVDTVIANLVGNIILFLPMGAFLPCLFQKLRPFKKTILTVLVIVFVIESTEILFAMGSFDIDDFIFNLSGAMIGYSIAKVPFIAKLRDRIFTEGKKTE